MTEHYKRRKEIILEYIRSYNTFDIDGMMKHLDEDIIFENYSKGMLTHKTEGILAFQEQAVSAKAYFVSREQTIREWNFTEDGVQIDIDYKAELAVDLPNGLKRGEVLQMEGTSSFIFNNNQIRHVRDES
jgi:hypothetical protein